MILKYLLPLLGLCVFASCGDLSDCKLRVYLAKAEQMDDNGLRCWDTVKVPACGGRCDSREISDWEFPFKKSHHPVCVHGSRRPLTARLRHCDIGVAEGTDMFHFVAAEDCRCKVCSSQFTSCEWLPPNSTLLDKINKESEDSENSTLDQLEAEKWVKFNLQDLITDKDEFLWRPFSSSVRSAPRRHNVILSRNIQMHSKFQLNWKSRSGSNLTCKI